MSDRSGDYGDPPRPLFVDLQARVTLDPLTPMLLFWCWLRATRISSERFGSQLIKAVQLVALTESDFAHPRLEVTTLSPTVDDVTALIERLADPRLSRPVPDVIAEDDLDRTPPGHDWQITGEFNDGYSIDGANQQWTLNLRGHRLVGPDSNRFRGIIAQILSLASEPVDGGWRVFD